MSGSRRKLRSSRWRSFTKTATLCGCASLVSGQPVQVEVTINEEGGQPRAALLTISERASLAEAAAEFCCRQGLSHRPECTYQLAEALSSRTRGSVIGDAGPHRLVMEDDQTGYAKLQEHSMEALRGDRGVLLFVHLKKCGGSTLQHHLLPGPLTHATEEMRWFFNHGDQAMARWSAELAGARVVADHIPFGFHALISPRPHVYMTMLREPRSRILSYYRYLQVATDWEYPCEVPGEAPGTVVQTTCRNNWWPQGLPRNASVSEWLQKQVLETHYARAHIDNYQTRMLCGPLGMKQVGPADVYTLLCAKHNLRAHFALVGITERMPEFACLVADALSLPEPVEGWSAVPRINSSKMDDGDGESSEELDVIPDLYVNLDTELYRYAQELFSARLAQHPRCRLSVNNSTTPMSGEKVLTGDTVSQQ